MRKDLGAKQMTEHKTPPIPESPDFRLNKDGGPEFQIYYGMVCRNSWVSIQFVVESLQSKTKILREWAQYWIRRISEAGEVACGREANAIQAVINEGRPLYSDDREWLPPLVKERDKATEAARAWRAWDDALLKGAE